MHGSLEVADVFRRHGPAYRETHAGHLSRGQRRVMGAIETCRSAALGGHVEQCNDCGQLRIPPTIPAATSTARSAKGWRVLNGWPTDNPSCCRCRTSTSSSRCRRRSPRSLSTIRPSSMASCSRPPPKRCVIAADPRHLGAEIGLVAVLHTWGQNLHDHPHVHCVVPGGGPSADRSRWIGCRPGFFLPVKVLSCLYRRAFPDPPPGGVRCGRAPVLWRSDELGRASRVRCLAAAVACHSLGRLRQATVRRTPAGA